MVSGQILYEQPLNERIRTFLRLEHLMAQLNQHLSGEDILSSQGAINTLIELFSLSMRGDLKSELMKELERQISNLNRLEHDPEVDQSRLAAVIGKQRHLITKLHSMSGQLGQELKENDFLNSIRQRSAVPGGTCDFDLPAYHYWLNRSVEERHDQIRSWSQPFVQVEEAIGQILELIRDSAIPELKIAENGFYQQALDPSRPYQLIRILLPRECGFFPEISAGKHRFSVRFLELGDLNERPGQIDESVEFLLACGTL
jgi:cell division protein ZapD